MPTRFAVALAVLAAVPATLVRLHWLVLPIEVETLLFGLAIVGAAFAMSWAAEAAERDIPRALALTVVALLAVFPEYAVDIIFAHKAGYDPSFAPYAAANMTGSNRLLLGLGWPTVAVLAWLFRGTRSLRLDRDAGLPLVFLGVATVYSFSLPLRAEIGIIDSVLLIGLFLGYAVLASREHASEPDLVGPAATIGALSTVPRRVSILCLFAFAGISIGAAAEPFAEGLVQSGEKLGIDEFLLVQWLAPLASEAPEFLLAALLTVRGKAAAAMGLLLSSKLNQWTLLVGSLPLAYSIGAGHPAALPLDLRQVDEVFLTAAQSLFGIAVLASLSLELGEAALLAGIFLTQLIVGGFLRAGLHDDSGGDSELVAFGVLYVLLSLVFFYRARGVVSSLWRKERANRSVRVLATRRDPIRSPAAEKPSSSPRYPP
jgi:cation:H+ antiporter